MIIKTKTISYTHRAYFFWAMAFLSILSLAIYIFAINATARNIAHGQEFERQIAQIGDGLGSLEFTYIGIKNNVTLELAHQYGFKEVRNPLFVSRSSTNSLSFNNLRR